MYREAVHVQPRAVTQFACRPAVGQSQIMAATFQSGARQNTR